MTKLTEIRILPPLAISRLGNAPEPVNNYDVEVDPQRPLDFRRITPAPTLIVDPASGRITACEPLPVTWKDEEGRVRPVAPFLELWGLVGDDWVHLTTQHLDDAGVKAEDVRWRMNVGNVKVFRRTADPNDQIEADSGWFSDHARHDLRGECKNFYEGKFIALGRVQYIQPTEDFPELRVRYTPAEGKVYGSGWFELDANGQAVRANAAGQTVDGGNYLQHDLNISDVVYDPSKGKWQGYSEPGSFDPKITPGLTIPGAIYAGQSNATSGAWVSRGYLDDECDGTIEVELTIGGKTLSSFARIGAGPPAFAPDSFPIRTAYDELEQALLGPEIADGDYTDEELQAESEEIIRRAFETVRLMNTAIMNGNAFDGKLDIGSTMVRQDRGDTERAFEPIMAPTIVDNIAVRTLHQNVFTSLRSGTPPWFMSVIRRFDEIGDLTDKGRRKMPAMMRNADGRYLTLTRRQFEKIRLAARRLTTPAEQGTGKHK
jgi:hypothetical protein